MGFEDYGAVDLYITAIYFTVTTIVTVGYGDIAAYSAAERIFCIIIMLIGVVAFSFSTGSLASMIANADSKESELR